MTMHKQLDSWVRETADLCQPEQVVWCDGSENEYQAMLRRMVQAGTAMRLAQRSGRTASSCAPIPPTSRASRSSRSSAPKQQDDAGPTNHWRDPAETKAMLRDCSRAR